MSSSDARKIFVGGLTLNTSQQMLSSYFGAFGDIEDAIVMTDKITGRPRGFGFVTFKEQEAVERVLLESHSLDGRTVECKRAVPLEQQGLTGGSIQMPSMAASTTGLSNMQSVMPPRPVSQPPPGSISTRAVQEGEDSGYNPKKIFVGGLPASCDEAKMRAYFSKYGPILDCVVMIDRVAQRHRGFGYVTFEDPKGVDQCMAEHDSHQIDGKWIDVKRCVIQDPAQRKQQGYIGGPAAGPIRRRENFPMPGGAADYYYNAPPSAYYAGYGATAAYRPPQAPGMYPQVGTARPAVADPYYAARMGAGMGGAIGNPMTGSMGAMGASSSATGMPAQQQQPSALGISSSTAATAAAYGARPYGATPTSQGYPSAASTGGYPAYPTAAAGYNAGGYYYGQAAGTNAYYPGYGAQTGGYAAYGQARPADYYGATSTTNPMTYGMYGVPPAGASGSTDAAASAAAGAEVKKSPGGTSAAGYRSGPY